MDVPAGSIPISGLESEARPNAFYRPSAFASATQHGGLAADSVRDIPRPYVPASRRLAAGA